MSLGLGTTSLHEEAPKVAVHEIGHSLFNLADEYSYGWGTDEDPNCDTAGCAKWQDLQDVDDEVRCVAGCEDNNYYVASPASLMRTLSGKWDAVSRRVSCCKYYFYLEVLPAYCEKFDEHGLVLKDYCQDQIWHDTLPDWLTKSQAFGVEGQLKTVANDPSGLKHEVVSKPVRWLLSKSSDCEWKCKQVKRVGKPGVFLKREVLGEILDSTEDPKDPGTKCEIAKVEAVDAQGISRLLLFRSEILVEVPPSVEDGHFSSSSARIGRDRFEIILEEGEECKVSDL